MSDFSYSKADPTGAETAPKEQFSYSKADPEGVQQGGSTGKFSFSEADPEGVQQGGSSKDFSYSEADPEGVQQGGSTGNNFSTGAADAEDGTPRGGSTESVSMSEREAADAAEPGSTTVGGSTTSPAPEEPGSVSSKNPIPGEGGGSSASKDSSGNNTSSSGGNTRKNISDGIIGLPPQAYWDVDSDSESIPSGIVTNKALACYGIMDIIPCYPEFGDVGGGAGLSLYHLDEEKAIPIYKEILKNLGFSKEEHVKIPIRVAFLNDVAITESFSSDYGESSLEGAVGGNEGFMSELRKITGSKTLKESLDEIGNKSKQNGGVTGNAGNLAAKGAGLVAGVGDGVLRGLAGDAAAQMWSGSKTDFPKIWQNSQYSASFSFTVRLYNPDPTNKKMYEEFILLPQARLLPLTLPYSDSLYTYTFPFVVKVNCPGLFCVDAGYISSIEIIKGGEANDITYHHQPGTIDLRITIVNLYDTMTIDQQGLDANNATHRPTLARYFDNLRKWADYDPFYVTNKGSGRGSNKVPTENVGPPTPLATGEEPTDRTSDVAKSADEDLKNGGTRVGDGSVSSSDSFAEAQANEKVVEKQHNDALNKVSKPTSSGGYAVDDQSNAAKASRLNWGTNSEETRKAINENPSITSGGTSTELASDSNATWG